MALHTSVGRVNARGSGDNEGPNTLFGPTSDSNVSPVIQVEDDPIVVRAFNLVEGDVVLVEMVDGEGAGRDYAPFCPFDGQSNLTRTRNVLPIGVPGRYRFVLARDDGGEPSIGLCTVRYQRATMSHEWLVAYLRCSA
ncbi:hypothetical protein [Dyella sp.]|uniref:hypothetical protein n=1 Tax=Dyella sp. TaxID=1869338 RepID=UPI002FDB5AED